MSYSTYTEVKKIMKMLKDSKAVSPVIGVMLMLVVTVILAAAVSSTSSGLIKSTDSAPTAVFDVECVKDVDSMMSGITTSYLQIKEVTGDSIPTKDLKIVITANGTITETLPNNGLTDYTNVDYGYSSTGSAPYWNNGVNYFGETNVDFGNYTVKPGVSMIADEYSNFDGDTCLKTMIPNWDDINDGDFINVKLVHLPTQKVIFTTNVEVV